MKMIVFVVTKVSLVFHLRLSSDTKTNTIPKITLDHNTHKQLKENINVSTGWLIGFCLLMCILSVKVNQAIEALGSV